MNFEDVFFGPNVNANLNEAVSIGRSIGKESLVAYLMSRDDDYGKPNKEDYSADENLEYENSLREYNKMMELINSKRELYDKFEQLSRTIARGVSYDLETTLYNLVRDALVTYCLYKINAI